MPPGLGTRRSRGSPSPSTLVRCQPPLTLTMPRRNRGPARAAELIDPEWQKQQLKDPSQSKTNFQKWVRLMGDDTVGGWAKSKKAAEALEKELGNMRLRKVWDCSTVREYYDVKNDPNIVEALFGRCFSILGIKNEELEEALQVWKARIVFQMKTCIALQPKTHTVFQQKTRIVFEQKTSLAKS